MFIFKESKLRCNPYQAFVDADGTQYVRVPQELYEEIPDPVRGNDEVEYTQEINEAPYVIITPKSQEQLDAQNNSKTKAQIAALESTQARCVRECALSGDKVRLQGLDDEIAALRKSLKPEPKL